MTAAPQADHPGPLVLVSHATADKARFVDPFVRALPKAGIRVWVDSGRILPGDSLAQKIFTDGMAAADAVVLVWSHDSARSPWVAAELDAAFARRMRDGLRIVVVRLDDEPVPTALAGLYWVDVDPGADWSVQLQLVVRALAERHGAQPARTAPAPDDRLRQMLTDPSRLLAAHEYVTRVTTAAVGRLGAERPAGDPAEDLPRQVHGQLGRYDRIVAPLAEVLAHCGYFGDPGQPRLWTRPVQRVLRTALAPDRAADAEVWERLAWYPALALTTSVGVAAVAGGREGVLCPLLTHPVPGGAELRPVWRVLAPDQVVDPEVTRRMPGWTGSRHALSVHLRDALRPAFGGILADDEYAEAFERYEYLRSLLELHLSGGESTSLGAFAWSLHNRRSVVSARISDEVAALGRSWPLLRAGAFGGSVRSVGAAQTQLRVHLRRRFA